MKNGTINITVRDVDKRQWQKLKADAALEGKSLSQKLNEILRDRK